ncbi:MAG: hypothetical protein M3340_00985 [Actinomycetota bacterium]|nr:hypothetical protein [Actinomycetota bacterium]
MRGTRHIALLFIASALLAAPQTASAQRDREGCFEHLSRTSRVIDETRFGIVFRKGDYVYGCIYSTGRIRRLPEQDPLGPPVTGVGVLRLDGRYVGYGVEDEEGGAQVLLYDLKTGTRVFTAGVFGPETGSDPNVTPYSLRVRSIVVKANGTTAWIGEGSRKVGQEPVPGGGFRDITEPVLEVVVRRPGDTESRALDSGSDIAPRSIAKSADEQTLFWTRGGSSRSAPLP